MTRKKKQSPPPDWRPLLLLALQAVLQAQADGHLEWLWQLLS